MSGVNHSEQWRRLVKADNKIFKLTLQADVVSAEDITKPSAVEINYCKQV